MLLPETFCSLTFENHTSRSVYRRDFSTTKSKSSLKLCNFGKQPWGSRGDREVFSDQHTSASESTTYRWMEAKVCLDSPWAGIIVPSPSVSVFSFTVASNCLFYSLCFFLLRQNFALQFKSPSIFLERSRERGLGASLFGYWSTWGPTATLLSSQILKEAIVAVKAAWNCKAILTSCIVSVSLLNFQLQTVTIISLCDFPGNSDYKVSPSKSCSIACHSFYSFYLALP